MHQALQSGESSAKIFSASDAVLRDEALRRLIDVAFVVLSLPILFAFVAVVAVLTKLSVPRESIFYSADRLGKHGKRFKMWKFRTMRNDIHLVRCEEIIRKFEPERNFKLESDPRISRLGAALRRTHLDEIPQLFNVLKGDMSLFGPRPNSRPLSCYEPWQMERLAVRPGITGPWQIFGSRDVDYAERFADDIQYIRTRTIRSDFLLLFQTVLHCLGRKGMV